MGAKREDFARMVTQDFWEIGASGRRYSREFVLEELEKRFEELHEDVWEAWDFCCSELAPGVFLLTYALLQDGTRLTRRTTIWMKTAQGWQARFHQGTIVARPGQ